MSENDKTFETSVAKNGEKILYVSENGLRVRMNSKYNPTYEAETWSKKYKQDASRHIIAVLGFSDGYFLRALKKRYRPDTIFIVYEPSKKLFEFVETEFDVSDLTHDENIIICFPSDDMNKIYDGLYMALADDRTTSIGIITPGYVKSDEFVTLCDKVGSSTEGDRAYRVKFGKDSFYNIFYAFNILHNNYLESDLMKKIPTDIPVIIVAGGPSLLKNVDDLKKVNNNALIVSTDRAVSTLVEHGVIPHIAVTVDPLKDPDFLRHDEIKNVPLISAFSSNKVTLQEHNGDIYFSSCELDLNQLPGMSGKNENIGENGGSVATFAYKLFQHYKFKNVILIGQDLAYQGEKTHADNKNDEVINKETLIEVEGMYGDKLYTSPNLKRYLNFFEHDVARYPETHVVDATEGGALIRGTEILTLQDAIKKYCVKQYDIESIISSVPHAQTTKEHEQTIEYIKDRLKELSDIKKISKELKPLCYRLMNVSQYGDIREKKYWKMYNQIDDLRLETYNKVANMWLEGRWISNAGIVPDHVYYMRDNDEAYPVLKKAYEYYSVLPKECDGLARMLIETFSLEGEYEYDEDQEA